MITIWLQNSYKDLFVVTDFWGGILRRLHGKGL